jgi:pantoate--beta-alanine ligase
VRTVHTVAELRAQVTAWRRAGARVGFVPTMGNLHEGHLQLVRRAAQVTSNVVVSIFVNPLQFGPSEDFDRYPRTLEADCQRLASEPCALVFAPTVDEMYPRGRDHLSGVRVPALSDILEGHFRPGFFDGVATVVSILFNQVQPDVAVFGEKDWQQLQVIRRMVADLHLPIEILGHPTAREADGLALSSRNQYLSAAERRDAVLLQRVLRDTGDALIQGRRDYTTLQTQALQRLAQGGFRPQYVEIREPKLGLPAPDSTRWVLLAAAYMGTTRLIDNHFIES